MLHLTVENLSTEILIEKVDVHATQRTCVSDVEPLCDACWWKTWEQYNVILY